MKTMYLILMVMILMIGCENPMEPMIPEIDTVVVTEYVDAEAYVYDMGMNVHVLRMAFLVETKRVQSGFDIVGHLTQVVGYVVNDNVPMITFSSPYEPIETPMVWKEG